MNRVNISDEQHCVAIDRALLKKIVRAVISREMPEADYQISICLVTDRRIRELNRRFHHRDTATDVIAFSLGQGPQEIIADIFVSAERAVSQARRFRTNPRYETYLYGIHGVLHCAGFDDRTAADRRAMRRAEKKYLNMFNIR